MIPGMSKKVASIINAKGKADVTLLLAPYERSASFRKGTKNGPAFIADCLDHQIEFYDRELNSEPIQNFTVSLDSSLKNLNSIADPKIAVSKLYAAHKKIVASNSFPVMLGGEHSMTIGVLQSLKEKYNPKDVTILHIDAHLDMRSSDADYSAHPSTFAHSTVMRHAGDMGYNIVSVGIRTGSTEEFEYAKSKPSQITVFEWPASPTSQGGSKKNRPTIEKILATLKTKYVYLSIDVDGIDPGFMPATGTPVQGGLDWYFALELFNKVGASKKLIGFDIVEVSPARDDVRTEFGAAQICYNILARHFN
jgi:agmatinase